MYLLCVMSPEPESDKEWRAGAEIPDIRLDGTPGTWTLLRDEAGEQEKHRGHNKQLMQLLGLI